MSTLARADSGTLESAWRAWEPKPEVRAIRGPEAGLVMVRGRVDADGARFNLGEATVTRATVCLSGGGLAAEVVGSAYVLGTETEHARVAAIFDGLLLDENHHDRVLAEVIAPLARSQATADAAQRTEARSTLVDFFTVAREHE